jgi:hypothetical protein
MNLRSKLFLMSAIMMGLVIGSILASFEELQHPREHATVAPVTIVVEQHSSYALLTYEQMIDQADAIFLGKVKDISRTSWNQNNGEYWEGGFQLHAIELEAILLIVDSIGLNEQVTITALGSSPLDGHADHDLKVGDQAVFFVRQTELAWRDGVRPILELMTVPSYAYFQRGSDGLYHGPLLGKPLSIEDVINQIAQRRATLVQS